MKRIVVYQSGTGFTAKYANWIAEELGCEAKEYKSVKSSALADFDQVIYGGWIMASTVAGYNKIKSLNLKNLVVFGVGIALPDEEVKRKIAGQSNIPSENFFYFAGGYNPKKLGFMKKQMMNMMKKTIEKKQEKTAQEIHMLESFKGVDYTKKEAISELVTYCKNGEM